MFKDRLKTMLGGGSQDRPSTAGASRSVAAGGAQESAPHKRQSHGLEQFFAALRDLNGLSIIDFAGASQANISFITDMGHRISSEDYVRTLERAFSHGDFYDNQTDAEKVDPFVAGNLNYPPETFDGALVWDSLQFLSPALLQVTVDKLYDILRPGAYLLAFFEADEKAVQVPTYHYRIADHKTLSLTPRGVRKRAQFFNNRGLEKLFQRFQSVKFFLTRDSLREIIVRR